jgi:hypothetical protein
VFVVPAHRDVELVFVVLAYLVLLDQMVHDVGQLLAGGVEVLLQLSEPKPFRVIEEIAENLVLRGELSTSVLPILPAR